MNINISKLRPTRGKLIGEILSGDYVSRGGIFIVNSLKKKTPEKVKILAIARQERETNYPRFENAKGVDELYRAKPGQTAYIKRREGQRMTIDRKDYLVIENIDIVAVEG